MTIRIYYKNGDRWTYENVEEFTHFCSVVLIDDKDDNTYTILKSQIDYITINGKLIELYGGDNWKYV